MKNSSADSFWRRWPRCSWPGCSWPRWPRPRQEGWRRWRWRGGGGGSGGGGARRGGGGAAKQTAGQQQPSQTCGRTTFAAPASTTSIPVNRNTNVNVNVDQGGCCNNGWDNDYHPVATAAAVTATVAVTSAVIGSMVRTVPPGCVPVNYGGMVYQQCGTTWYQPQGGQYVVINPPY